MKTLIRKIAVAGVAAAACMTAAAVTPAAASPQAAITQDLSARCRTVVSTRWNGYRHVTVRKSVCGSGYYGASGPHYGYASYGSCRTVVKTRWSNGRRVSVRTRVC